MAWLTGGWGKRQKLTLTGGASGAQTAFQLKLTVAYDSDMQVDFDDLRFTQSDGTTLVDCWLESKTDSISAIVWVEFPTTPANTVTEDYYMYYGNSGASNVWNGTNTFLHFDDFSGSSVDTGKWATNQSPTVSGGFLTCDANTEYVKSLTSWNQNVAHRFNAKFYGTANPWAGFQNGTSTPLIRIIGDYPNAGDCTLNNYVSSHVRTDMGNYLDAFYTFEIEWLSASTKGYVDDVLKATHTSQIASSSLPVEFLSTVTGHIQADWSLVRKHVANPATYGFGGEESAPSAGHPTMRRWNGVPFMSYNGRRSW